MPRRPAPLAGDCCNVKPCGDQTGDDQTRSNVDRYRPAGILVAGENHCGATHVGRVRERNEDAFWLAPDRGLLVVADGMGGHEAGDRASEAAIAAVDALLTKERLEAARRVEDGPAAVLVGAFSVANEEVQDLARALNTAGSIGSTIVAALVNGDDLVVCHVGDVRAYVASSGRLKQITEDQSFVASLVRSGELTAAQARRHPDRGRILQAVGIGRHLMPGISTRVLRSGDLLLLCSDGLWGEVQDRKIAAILADPGSLDQMAERLLTEALLAGARDNVTVALYRHPQATARAGACVSR